MQEAGAGGAGAAAPSIFITAWSQNLQRSLGSEQTPTTTSGVTWQHHAQSTVTVFSGVCALLLQRIRPLSEQLLSPFLSEVFS